MQCPTATAELWSPITLAYTWVHQIATPLSHPEGLRLTELQQQFAQILNHFAQILNPMEHNKAQMGGSSRGIDHFLKQEDPFRPWNSA